MGECIICAVQHNDRANSTNFNPFLFTIHRWALCLFQLDSVNCWPFVNIVFRRDNGKVGENAFHFVHQLMVAHNVHSTSMLSADQRSFATKARNVVLANDLILFLGWVAHMKNEIV